MRCAIQLALLSVCFGCLAQPFSPNDRIIRSVMTATAPAGFNLTNTPDGSYAKLNSWWRCDTVQTNGGNTYQLSDLWTNRYNLTNMAAASLWPTRSSSYSTLFKGNVAFGQYLKSIIYTNSAQAEVWMVVKFTACDSSVFGTMWAFSSTNNSFHQLVSVNTTTAETVMDAGSPQVIVSDGQTQWTNKWIAFTFGFDGANSAGNSFTASNNVVIKAGMTTKTQPSQGFTLNGRAADVAFGWGFELAEVFTYSTTNSPSVRSNIYYYLKNYSQTSTNVGLP